MGRNVRLTVEGQVLVGNASKILTQLEKAGADLAAAVHEPVGTIRVGAFLTVAESIVPGALAILSARKRLRVEVIEAKPSNALAALLSRDLDLLITEQFPGYPYPVPSEVTRLPIGHDPLYLARPGDDTSLDR